MSDRADGGKKSMVRASTARPVWRRGVALWPVIGVILVAVMAMNTTFVGTDDRVVPADTAAEFAELNYDSAIVPSLAERAVPVAELVDRILEDPEGVGAELGRREDDAKPYSYAVVAEGVVSDGGFGEVALAVEGMDEAITVGIAVPPLGSSTALRDAGAELTFGDFANQTEYQNVAIELNNRAADSVYGELDPESLIDQSVVVTGALTWVSKTGGEVTHVTIVPVSIEVLP